jgi:two-component system phosphate regulon sensor histidine kinase PhoR
VVVLVLLVGTGLRHELEDLYRERVERELVLGRELLARSTGDAGSAVELIAGGVSARVTIVAPDGRVLADSEVPRERLPDLENHAGRPEVRGALEGRVSFDRRLSATAGIRYLYGATPAGLGGAPVVLRIATPLRAIDAVVRRSQRAVALAGILATLLALVTAYLLSRAFGRPLRSLADRAGRLATGDFSQRVTGTSRVAELDELGHAFNRLADELQGRLRELGRQRDEVQAQIDCMAEGVIALTGDGRVFRTNRAAREMLRIPEPPTLAPVSTIVRQPQIRDLLEEAVAHPVQTREISLGDLHLIVSSRVLDGGGVVATFLDVSELRRLEQVRRDFVANASHELKTPLTAMRGFAETLLEDEPPEELKREFLTSIQKNTVRLQRLVDDLLDLSRLESGGWKARRDEVELTEATEEAWQAFAEAAEQRGIEFNLRGSARALADDRGLRQIFENLFDNALRYTPDGGRITVTLRAGDRLVDVAVSDTGIGIPSRSLARIFERFYRVDAARDREMGGTGLGLSIVRHLVSAMGGKVTAESELGRGTTIRFTLPASPVPTGRNETERRVTTP